MGRLILILLIFLAVRDRDLRAHAEPYARWALDPVYEQQARWRLQEMAGSLKLDVQRGAPLPTSATLPAYLDLHGYGDDAAWDPWGTALRVELGGGTVRLASAGRDFLPGTADDIRSREVPLRAP